MGDRPGLCGMSRGLIAGLVMALPAPVFAQQAAPGVVWDEVDGVVSVEIESVPASKGWIEETALDGFTGRGYYTDAGGGDPLVYRVRVLEAGRYRLRLRNRHEHPDATLENDCWTQVDDGPKVKTFSSQRGQWTWHTRHEHPDGDKPEASYELAAGLHTLRISGRSKGFRIDRFHLFREGVAGSTDERRPESMGVPGLGPLARLKGVGGLLDRMEYGAAMQAATREARSADPETAVEARRVLEGLEAHAAARKEALARLKEKTPEEAAGMLAELARQYQPGPVGHRAAPAGGGTDQACPRGDPTALPGDSGGAEGARPGSPDRHCRIVSVMALIPAEAPRDSGLQPDPSPLWKMQHKKHYRTLRCREMGALRHPRGSRPERRHGQ